MRKGGLIALACAAGFAAYVIYGLANLEPIQVVESRLERSATAAWVAGRIRNTAAESRDIVLEVRLFDSEGQLLGEETLEIGELAAGAEARFSSAPHPAGPRAARYSLVLNHAKNPYGN
jgi:hypothetical protein